MNQTTPVNVFDTIDAQKISKYQLGIIFLCSLIVAADGFDAQVLGYVAPSLSSDWDLSDGALGPVFGIGLFGMMIGSLVCGPVADKFGRKKMIIGATFFFGVCTLATTTADSLTSLSVWRFLTGLGLGGAYPNAIALTSEYSPKRRRAMMVMLMFLGFGMGSAIAGAAAAKLLGTYGLSWTSMFMVGGLIPIFLAVVLIFALPESPSYLALKGGHQKAIQKIFSRMDPEQIWDENVQFVTDGQGLDTKGLSVRHLFSEQRALGTLMLWIMFSGGLFSLYFLVAWLPTIIFDLGVSIELASLITANMQVAITVATLLVATCADKIGIHRLLPWLYMLGAICIASIGFAGTGSIGVIASSSMLVAISVFAAGFFVGGSQNSANALATIFYPTAVRSTGISWGHGVGRVASILGPVVGGLMLASQQPIKVMFGIVSIPMACAAVAAFVLSRKYDSTLRTDLES
jgi:MFS transporter, AAHS family, 4-hydroxybenzoate transporter